MTQNTLEGTVLTDKSINWAYWKESGDRSKVIFIKAKCRAEDITWSLSPSFPMSCPLNWCCLCSIYQFPSTCSPVSREFLQDEFLCFLIQGHLFPFLFPFILFPFLCGLKLHSVCLKFSQVLYCKLLQYLVKVFFSCSDLGQSSILH